MVPETALIPEEGSAIGLIEPKLRDDLSFIGYMEMLIELIRGS